MNTARIRNGQATRLVGVRFMAQHEDIMPFLSHLAAKKKLNYFAQRIPKSAAILEVGCGSRWVRKCLNDGGWHNYVGLDIVPPADVVGDIRNWRELGLAPASFDAILAFEVVEHVDCFQACYDLLKPGGMLMVTTPVPHMDWVMKLLEWVGLNQKRTSPHDHLNYLRNAPYFEERVLKTVAFLAQWGILIKKPNPLENRLAALERRLAALEQAA